MTAGLVVVLDEWLRPQDIVARLRQERLRVWHAAKALAESVTGEERCFTDEEQGRWDLMMTDLDHLDSRLRLLIA